MLAHRLRRWPNINPAAAPGLVYGEAGAGTVPCDSSIGWRAARNHKRVSVVLPKPRTEEKLRRNES